MISLRRSVSFCVLLAALTACSGVRQYVSEKYSGERYGDPVAGPRRPPVLNPGYTQTQRIPVAPAPMAKVAEEKKPVSKPEPYEQYDAEGNDRSRTNYIDKWFGNSDKPATPSERKPFKGSVAALQPVMPVEIIPQHPPAHFSPPASDVKEKPIRVIQPTMKEEYNGVFLPDVGKRSEIQAPTMQFAQLQPAAGGQAVKAYPHLSDVPKTPAAMDVVKAKKEEMEEELQSDHDAAMEQRQRLNEEPTELPSATLPQVQGMIEDIKGAITGDTPIIQAAR